MLSLLTPQTTEVIAFVTLVFLTICTIATAKKLTKLNKRKKTSFFRDMKIMATAFAVAIFGCFYVYLINGTGLTMVHSLIIATIMAEACFLTITFVGTSFIKATIVLLTYLDVTMKYIGGLKTWKLKK